MGSSSNGGSGDGLKVSGNDGVLEAIEEGGDGAGGQGTHEMARSRPNAEADKEVKLVWSIDGGALEGGEEEAEAIEKAKRAIQ